MQKPHQEDPPFSKERIHEHQEHLGSRKIETNSFQKPIQFNIDKEYSQSELAQIKKEIESKEGTIFKKIIEKDQLSLKCEGFESIVEKRDHSCEFMLIFKIQNVKPFGNTFDGLIQDQEPQKYVEDLGNKMYKMIKVQSQHSVNFVFNRNLNFIKQNSSLLQQLISQNYLLTNNKPQSPKIYRQYISDVLGYDFMFHGYKSTGQKLTFLQKQQKSKIARFFDNEILKKGRDKYQIPLFKVKPIMKKQKPKYQTIKGKHIEKEEYEEHEELSPYTVNIRKQNQSSGKRIKLRSRTPKIIKSQSEQ